MTEEVIRPARAVEVGLLSDLALRSKGYWGYDADFLEACREELTVAPGDIEPRRVTVFERDGTVLGFYGLDGEAPDGELWWLFVDPSAIGTGAGKALWTHARRTALRLKWERMRTEADPGAEAFYLAMGARRIGEVSSQSIPGRVLPLLEYELGKEPLTLAV
ncbi:MAG: GNAT family N-acetyltransferase [Dehalococcoidia bacterium]